MDDFCGSGTVQDKPFGLAMCNIWADSVSPLQLLYRRDESGGGEMKEECGSGGGGGGGRGGWVKGRMTGV